MFRASKKQKQLDIFASIPGMLKGSSYDQFTDNFETLKETFGDKKLDVVIDDAFHSDESIINTFNELQPYLAEKFVYFGIGRASHKRCRRKRYNRQGQGWYRRPGV